ncbi:adenylate cyclase, putative [Bodo saltans]|uniref:Adenylate cyclase, putative n=1 Tax=Bodo saltans TaxID=75058 RepID=A0A0S4JRY5_BODSA|nr:adenylate cyclase, putative [Bodo saltans]|eukprot:CUG92148.1 adenylate cyclase, putative [Bodo saltans]
MSLDWGQQIQQRLLRVPAAIFVGLIVFVSALCCGVIAFLPLYFPVNHLARETLIEFTDATADVTIDKVQRRFDVFRSQALLAQKILAETPAFVDLDSVNHDSDALLPLQDTLLWFARSLDASSLFLIIYHGLKNGLIVSPYSIFDPVHFERKPGLITVANLSQASWTSYIVNAYYRLDTFQPLNITSPFTRNTSNRFNVAIRPYTPVFQQAGYTLRWSPIYIGVTYRATRTSSIGFGSSWGTSGGHQGNVSARNTVGIHGYTKDVVSFFKTLKIAKTGVAFLVDVASRAFVGGNIADESLRFEPTIVNGSASPTLTTPQLMLLEQLQDPRVVDVIHAASSSHNVSQNMLLTCTSDHAGEGGDPSCLLAYDHGTKRIYRMRDSSSFSLVENVVSVVHISEVRDEFGLNMRLVIIIPSDDFVGAMRAGVIQSLVAASVAITALMVFVAAVTQLWLLRPLGEIARVLSKIVDCVGDDDTFTEASCTNGKSGAGGQTESTPQRNDDETGNLVAPSGSSSDHCSSSTSPALPSLVIIPSTHNHSTNNVDYNANNARRSPPAVARRKKPRQLFHHRRHHPRFLRIEVESIATNGVRELTIIKRGLLKLLSALEIVGLFLPEMTTTDNELVEAEVVPSTIADSIPLVLAAGGNKDVLPLAAPTKTLSPRGKVIVTTIAANFVKLQRLLEHVNDSPSTFVALHTEYLKIVFDSCRAHGGTVDLFYGDRIWAHFNAEKRLPGHALKACRAVLAIEDALKQRLSCKTHTAPLDEALQIRVRLGAATTEAICGVMGSSEVKRFTVVGPCVRKATFLSNSAADRRLPLRGKNGSDVPAMLNTTMQPVDLKKKVMSDAFPFSSLVSDKTVELASIRTSCQTARVPIPDPLSSSPPFGHKNNNTRSSHNNTQFASIIFRHVRVSALPQGRTTDSGTAERVVISTPVFLHRVLEEYPEHVIAVGGSDAASAALNRLKAANAIFELLAAGDDETNALMQKMSALPFLEDEWLLRQLQRERFQI